MAQYSLKEITIKPATTDGKGHAIPRRVEFAYTKKIQDLESQPHRGIFREDEKEKELPIAADGMNKRAKEILDDAGITLN